MKVRTIIDGNDIIRGKFDKEFHGSRYDLYFNTKTGFEVLTRDPHYTDRPTMLDIGIMGHCENKCSFCYQGSKKQEHMKLEDFKSIINQVKHHANQVALGGRGNPEDHPDFEEIIRYARENNVVPNYTTAGNIVDDRIVGLTKEYCGAVAVSMYHEAWTFEALNKFIKAGMKTNIHWIYDRYSHYEIANTLNYSAEAIDAWGDLVDWNNLNAIILLLFKPKGKAKYMHDRIPLPYQIKELSQIFSTNSQVPFKIGMDSCLVNHTVPHIKLNRAQSMSLDTCESARMSVYISPDMKMIPCSFMDPINGIDLYEHGINSVWKLSQIFKEVREVLRKDKFICPAMRRHDE